MDFAGIQLKRLGVPFNEHLMSIAMSHVLCVVQVWLKSSLSSWRAWILMKERHVNTSSWLWVYGSMEKLAELGVVRKFPKGRKCLE